MPHSFHSIMLLSTLEGLKVAPSSVLLMHLGAPAVRGAETPCLDLRGNGRETIKN